MKCFRSKDGFNVEIDPEVLLIKAFNDLYVDRGGRENLIMKEFAYVYFFCDMESDFIDELDDAVRSDMVKKHVNIDPSWKPDIYVQDCCEVFIQRSDNASRKLLLAAKRMAEKIQNRLDSIDLDEVDKNGKPVHDIKKIIDSTKAIPGLIETLNKAESEYIKGQKELTMAKGSKTKSIYEDGL